MTIKYFAEKNEFFIVKVEKTIFYIFYNRITEISLFNLAISSARGGFVPSVRQAAVPHETAFKRHSEKLFPLAKANRNPAILLSPAPIVERASIFGTDA